jgi:uncharacterized protein (DUF2141 family)
MRKILLLSATLAALATAQAADLTVSVAAAGQDGAVYYALFERENFLQQPTAVAKSEAATPTTTFRDLQPGIYAVTVFQDLNGNGKLDRNLVGAPTEPLGFSNDARGNMGPPNFDAAAFKLSAGAESIVVTLRK